MVKATYKRWKKVHDSELEFAKSWNRLIHDTAVNVFYVWYTPPGNEKKKKIQSIWSTNEDGETIAPNGMSKDEYSRMRRYAESFPRLDIKALQKANAEAIDVDPDEDLLSELESFDG
jgi:hypothetical protein